MNNVVETIRLTLGKLSSVDKSLALGDVDGVQQHLSTEVGVDERSDDAHTAQTQPDSNVFWPVAGKESHHVAMLVALSQEYTTDSQAELFNL